jgi:hypothetical protein
MTSAEEIKAFRELHQCSLFDAKDHFKRKELLENLDIACKMESWRLLKDILKELIDDALPAKFDRPGNRNG